MDPNETKPERAPEENTPVGQTPEETQPEEQAPAVETAPAVEQTLSEVAETATSKNVVIVAVLAIIVLVLAFMYVWGSSNVPEDEAMGLPEAPQPPAIVEEDMLPDMLSASDEVTDIEEDLGNTELEELDAELETLEAELDAELEAL